MTDPTSPQAGASTALEEALAYLTPHWLTNGPVVLDGPKMQAAVAEVRSEIATLLARATAAETKQAHDLAWYETIFSVIEEQRDNYRARATAAEAERDEARATMRDLHRRTQNAERFRDRWKSWSWMFNKRCTEQRRRMKAENNLIALAKMYGEACGELQLLRMMEHSARLRAGEGWQRATAAEATVRERDAEIERLRDPVVVHANMLRGTIARLSIESVIHLYGREALLAALNPPHPQAESSEEATDVSGS